jgi:PKD repeat protein
MRICFISVFLIIISLNLNGQNCNILSKANLIIPDKLCSPLAVDWKINYSGVNNAGTTVQIRFDWDDGNVDTENSTNTGAGLFEATGSHTYVATGVKCNYRPKATLVINGVTCSSSTQEQIVTVWDDDNHNGGHMHISPRVYPICFGNGANVKFQDLTQFNCVPPQEDDVPNLYTRWIQWIYGTDITMTGIPVTINGSPETYPLSAPIITLPGPVTGSGVYSDVINVANDKLIGQYFQVTLRNWNYCNPYDDPTIPGPPSDPVNGDHAPVVTTAIILIVPDPDATITPVDTLCIDNDPITLHAHDAGGRWSGDGVDNNLFDPGVAGLGDHIIRYQITDGNGCSDSDEITITVMPSPSVDITPVGQLFVNAPPAVLSATPPGGNWSGTGVYNGKFYPDSAGVGIHIINYNTLSDRFGCQGRDTIHIKVAMPAAPIAMFKPDTVGCSPLIVQFKNLSVNGVTFNWDFGDHSSSTERDPSHTYNLPGNYVVKLTVKNFAGQSTYNGLITVLQNPIPAFNLFPDEIINNSQIVIFTNYSYYAQSWFWTFGDGESSTEESPWHKYSKEGKYSISLKVTSPDGCIDSIMYKTKVVVEYKKGEIKFPNVFKWNESGPTGGYWEENTFNDNTFHPFFVNVIEYKLQIFNRWGVLLYESTDLQKGWDGYFSNSNLALQGVYVWKVVGRYADGSYFNKVGDVTFLH